MVFINTRVCKGMFVDYHKCEALGLCSGASYSSLTIRYMYFILAYTYDYDYAVQPYVFTPLRKSFTSFRRRRFSSLFTSLNGTRTDVMDKASVSRKCRVRPLIKHRAIRVLERTGGKHGVVWIFTIIDL